MSHGKGARWRTWRISRRRWRNCGRPPSRAPLDEWRVETDLDRSDDPAVRVWLPTGGDDMDDSEIERRSGLQSRLAELAGTTADARTRNRRSRSTAAAPANDWRFGRNGRRAGASNWRALSEIACSRVRPVVAPKTCFRRLAPTATGRGAARLRGRTVESVRRGRGHAARRLFRGQTRESRPAFQGVGVDDTDGPGESRTPPARRSPGRCDSRSGGVIGAGVLRSPATLPVERLD